MIHLLIDIAKGAFILCMLPLVFYGFLYAVAGVCMGIDALMRPIFEAVERAYYEVRSRKSG